MKTNFRLTTILLVTCALLTPTLSGAVDPARAVVATIGDYTLTLEEFWELIDELPPHYLGMLETEVALSNFIEQLIQEQVLYQAALADRLDRDPEVLKEIERMRVRTLASSYFGRQMDGLYGYSEEELRAFYQANPELFLTDRQVRVRHLTQETRSEALAARERLVNGELSFSDLAKEISTDPKTRRVGGMIGLVTEGFNLPQLGNIEPLLDVIFEMPVGEISQPIESILGWHLVVVEEVIEPRPLEFERIINRVADQKFLPEEESLRYYRDNPDEFLAEPEAQVRIIFCFNERDARNAHRALERGRPPRDVAAEFNEDDRTRAVKGLLGFVKRSTPVPVLGRQARDILSMAFDQLVDGEFSEPIALNEGYVIIIREGFIDKDVRPYAEVRAGIRGRMTSELQRKRIEDLFDTLRRRFNVRVDHEVMMTRRPPKEGPAELYAIAELAPPPTAIENYKKILEYYPNSDEAPRAQFMIGFIFAETLRNYDEAERAFRAYLDKWPQGELARDAQYMIDHMRDEE